ncbi:outer membrane beta-barrel protein [Mucilaginibacter sp.]|uniref:outer membrane beta-barrel protein n=1 Tax=Mucilaginibacter sp. TaxID=1882438 RepID=UPI00326690DB
MKKALLTFCLILFTAITFAQTVKFGLKAGLNLSKQTLTGAFTIESENLTGFHAGGIMDIRFANFSIQTGLLFSTKGERLVTQQVDINQQYAGTSTVTVKLNYLELPVNLLYKQHFTGSTLGYLGGGPYIGYGISGTASGNGSSSKLNFGNNNAPNPANYKNPDYGINFIGGVEINNVIIGVNYGLGYVTYLTGKV